MQLSLLALFDVSAAFDMVDHQILLEHLETSCGISSLPLLWIKSYLSDRTQMIVSGESRTSWFPIFLGVPQSSVLGPLLFILYTADMALCWVLFILYTADRALCWVLFSSSYILLTFPLSFQNIRLLVISLLTTFRHMFMVLLLVNFFSPAKLNYSQMILTLGCPQIDSL